MDLDSAAFRETLDGIFYHEQAESDGRSSKHHKITFFGSTYVRLFRTDSIPPYTVSNFAPFLNTASTWKAFGPATVRANLFNLPVVSLPSALAAAGAKHPRWRHPIPLTHRCHRLHDTLLRLARE